MKLGYKQAEINPLDAFIFSRVLSVCVPNRKFLLSLVLDSIHNSKSNMYNRYGLSPYSFIFFEFYEHLFPVKSLLYCYIFNRLCSAQAVVKCIRIRNLDGHSQHESEWWSLIQYGIQYTTNHSMVSTYTVMPIHTLQVWIRMPSCSCWSPWNSFYIILMPTLFT